MQSRSIQKFLRSAGIVAFVSLIAWPGAAAPIDAAEADLLLDRLIAGTAQYQNEAIGKKLAAGLEAGRAAYRQIGDDAALADALTEDMRRIGKDTHLRVRPGGMVSGAAPLDPAVRRANRLAEARANGFGLTDVRRLSGNIGYLRLSSFSDEEEGVAAVDAAMRILAGTDALVLDLRQCSGGADGMQKRLIGYFFATRIQMATIHWRKPDGSVETEEQFSDRAQLPAYLDRPVYVLLGARTFSACEAVAYDLQVQKRAVLVGATTRGGANPISRIVTLTRDLVALIPNGRTEHPRTGTNWEGVGVAPDIAVDEADALRHALRLALAETSKMPAPGELAKERAWAVANPDAAIAGQRWR
jgi:retinol-binding protein 3